MITGRQFSSFMGTLYFGPVLFQSVFGASTIESGVRLIPYMAFLIVGSLSSAELLRWVPYVKLYILTGAALNVLGWGLYYTINENSSWAQQACYIVFCGNLHSARYFSKAAEFGEYNRSSVRFISTECHLGCPERDEEGIHCSSDCLGKLKRDTPEPSRLCADVCSFLVIPQTNFALMFANSIVSSYFCGTQTGLR